uniref:DUF4795 domain-containing protein n=1 Tax=Electrophorus electricus TaxID=8005 RepID=A0A4W4HFI8_ELEEL
SPFSMVDISRKIIHLIQDYEKMHGMVAGFIKQHESDRAEQNFRILMSDVQGAILQLQVECEKLHSTTSQLMEAHLQKQSHINVSKVVLRAGQELEEKKADREVVETEIGIKADKHALETKVSRMQFDTMTEQLNGMFQELLSKVTGHEQDWHKVIEKISKEMESKLNRIELDPLKKQLEDRWRSINKQLQTQPAPVHDDAAGFRSFYFLYVFHELNGSAPLPPLGFRHLVTLPSPPGLPSHKTNRPYTIYEMEQMRHHSRSERIPEMTEYGYLALSRSCGGSHTLTFANRRYSRLQHITHLIQTEEDKEVDILGLDGHIYKGRLNNRAVKTVKHDFCLCLTFSAVVFCHSKQLQEQRQGKPLSAAKGPQCGRQLRVSS